NRNDHDVPIQWVKFIKNSIVEIASNFTTKKMIEDYQEKYYNKLYKRTLAMRKNDFGLAKKLALWKIKISNNWDNVNVVSVNIPDIVKDTFQLGGKCPIEIILNLKKLSPSNIGVEFIISDIQNMENKKLVYKKEFDLDRVENGNAVYKAEITLTKPGLYEYGFRIFPKHKDLPHRQDFRYIKWI
ncbi:unnamed protein product, partial [marine sediment metagenome]